jgi:hypothetical protein
MQYLMFVLAAILLFVLVVILNRIAADTICSNVVPVPQPSKEQKDDL